MPRSKRRRGLLIYHARKLDLCTHEPLKSLLFSFPPLHSQGIWSCIHGVHIDMKKKKPELNFSPQANMLHLLKSAKSVALSSPKRNTVLLQPSILDVMTGKGTRLHSLGQDSRL